RSTFKLAIFSLTLIKLAISVADKLRQKSISSCEWSNSLGNVCQGSGENVFLVKDGVLHTPDIAGGALDGITRQTVITIAKD
ncbi:aminotransferase class IV, partial [Acinetobacter soli]|uniref:aminotransferase class IV n=1 Tax=Acinetobacter soli TaxID=487316 RepID=UPI00209198B5